MSKKEMNISKNEMLFLLEPMYAKLLGLFFETSKEFYVSELLKKLRLSPKLGCEKLKKLRQVGLLNSKKRANAIYYSLNSDSFLVRELKRIYFISKNEVRVFIKELFDIGAIKVIVYGSIASGTYDEKSDFDIAVVGIELKKEQLQQNLKKYEKLLKRKISLVVLSLAEFEKIKERDPAFYTELQKGIVFENV